MKMRKPAISGLTLRKKPSILPRTVSQEPVKIDPKAKLKFIPFHESNELQDRMRLGIPPSRRNYSYQVQLDGTSIGILVPDFRGDRNIELGESRPISLSKMAFRSLA